MRAGRAGWREVLRAHHPPRLMAPKFKKPKLFSRQILYEKDFVEVAPQYYFNFAALILLAIQSNCSTGRWYYCHCSINIENHCDQIHRRHPYNPFNSCAILVTVILPCCRVLTSYHAWLPMPSYLVWWVPTALPLIIMVY